MKKLISVALLLLAFYSLTAITTKLDSLKASLPESIGEQRYQLLAEISRLLWYQAPVDGIDYAQESLVLARSLGDSLKVGYALHNMGGCYYFSGDYRTAMNYYTKALSLRQQLNDRPGISATYTNIGIIFDDLGDYDKALNYYHKSLAIDRELNDLSGQAKMYHNLASVYRSINEPQKALDYYHRSIDIETKRGNVKGTALTLMNLSNIYFDVERDTATALRLINQARQIKEQYGDLFGMASVYISLGETYFMMDQEIKARQFYQKAEKISREAEFKQLLMEALHGLGVAETYLEEYKGAEKHLDEALEIAEDIENPTMVMTIYQSLAYLYSLLKNYEQAYLYSNAALDQADSVYSMKLADKIAAMKVRYETQQVENTNRALRTDIAEQSLEILRQRNYLSLLVSLLVIAALIVFIIASRYSYKKKANLQLRQAYIKLKQTQNDLLALEKRNAALALAVTANHELNQPLMVVRGNIEILGMSLAKHNLLGDEHKKVLASIDKALDKATEILETYKENSGVGFKQYDTGQEMMVMQKNEPNDPAN